MGQTSLFLFLMKFFRLSKILMLSTRNIPNGILISPVCLPKRIALFIFCAELFLSMYQSLNSNLFESYGFSRIFFSVSVLVASMGNLRKFLTFHKKTLKWAFRNQNYKLFPCALNFSPVCYTIIIRQMVFFSKNFNVFIILDLSKDIYVQSYPLPLCF